MAGAASHAPLAVVLWHDEARGLQAGGTLTVRAATFLGAAPVVADSVTFQWGRNLPPTFVPTNYTAVFEGTTGKYHAVVNITPLDAAVGAGFLAVIANRSGEAATASAVVLLSASPLAPAPSNWTLRAYQTNARATGTAPKPGDTLNMSFETAYKGNLTAAPSLTGAVFSDFEGSRSGPSATLALAAGASSGVYTTAYKVPQNLTESRVLSFQLTLNESGEFARSNTTLEVNFYDVLLDLSLFDSTRVQGDVVVGDGHLALQGADVTLTFTGGSPVLGVAAGRTDARGHLAFDIATQGYAPIVSGWVNATYAQYVSQSLFRLPGFTPATPRPSGFDAVAGADTSKVPWRSNVSVPFSFYNNGTPWSNGSVVALLYGARGLLNASLLATDALGRATVGANLSLSPVLLEDLLAGGVHFLFRAAVGNDSMSSDGRFWAEDDQPMSFDFYDAYLQSFADPSVSVDVRAWTPGTPFGVAVRYAGAQDITGWSGVVQVLVNGPRGLDGTSGSGDLVPLGASGNPVWRAAVLKPGAPGEFFGVVDLPPYERPGNLTFVAFLGPGVGAATSTDSPGAAGTGVIGFATLAPGNGTAPFAPSAESRPPEVYARDLAASTGSPVSFYALAYDDALDFPERWQFDWQVQGPAGAVTFAGWGANQTFNEPGNFSASVTVHDGALRTASAAFVVRVADRTRPSFALGPDRDVPAATAVVFRSNASDNDPAFATTGFVQWSFDYNGTHWVSNGTDLTFTFWKFGNYTLTVVATDAAGNTVQAALQIHVVPPDLTPPIIHDLGGNRSVPLGAPVGLAANVTDDDPSFAATGTAGWSFTHLGGPVSLNGTSASFTFWQLGNVTLSFWAQDFWGNRAEANLTLNVTRAPTPGPTVDAGPDQQTRTGWRVDLHANASSPDPLFPAGANFTWSFNEGTQVVRLFGAAAFYAFRLEGIYLIHLQVTDRWNSTGADDLQALALGPDTTPPTVERIANRTVAIGTTLDIEAKATDNSPLFSYTANYTWQIEEGSVHATYYGKVLTYNFSDQALYVIALTVRDGLGNPAPVMSFSVRAELPDTRPPIVTAAADAYVVVVGQSAQFTGNATDRGAPIVDDDRFNWTVTLGAQTWTLRGQRPFFRFEEAGTYTVVLDVQDEAGNHAAARFTVVAKPAGAGGGFLGGMEAWQAGLALSAVGAAAVVRRARSREGPR